METFYNVKDFKVILFDDSGKTSEIEKIFNNKNLSNKEIKKESQVSNYTLEEIGQCLKDKGNDFKLQIAGADSKTKWLNIDKDDVQKIYNALSYKKKKTENLNINSITDKFPSTAETKMKLSISDFEDVFKTVRSFSKMFTSEQEDWLLDHNLSIRKIYTGMKNLICSYKVSIFETIISIDEYINELVNDKLAESTDLYNKIKA